MNKLHSAQLIVVSDTHCGSKLGLMPLNVELDDGNIVGQNFLQAEMWKFWEKGFWPEVHKRAKSRNTVVVLNGDLIDSHHHGTHQVWSTDPLEHISAAVELFTPIAAKYPIYVTRGTAAHVMASGAADEQIAKEIGAKQPDPKRKVRSSYHLKLEFGGCLIDIAHHGPNPGSRVWTRGNTLRGYIRTIVLDSLVNRRRPPDCIIRSHVHSMVRETNIDYGHKCEGVITPAFQWSTEYGHMVASHETISDVGGTLISIDGGKISDVEFKVLSFSQSDTVRIA